MYTIVLFFEKALSTYLETSALNSTNDFLKNDYNTRPETEIRFCLGTDFTRNYRLEQTYATKNYS